MGRHRVETEVRGPWRLDVSRAFWEGFSPNRLRDQDAGSALTMTFRSDTDWSRVEAVVHQQGSSAAIEVSGPGDLDAAVEQVRRVLALDVDGTGWPAVGVRDPVIGAAQAELPGLRPCGFYSPYEAAVWSVLSQRVRITQAAALRERITRELGDDGAFPAPDRLLRAGLDLPGRKNEYLEAVLEAALDGRLAGAALRAVDPEVALEQVRAIKGLGPFAAELVVLRGANAPDVLPTQEKRLAAEVADRYGGRPLAEVGDGWRPFRTWASVHLRALRERARTAA
ncbi:DNA-3-methyladenine glycosylase II [Friedmanniella endophytica]|uniref:DNA-3-methyladenine glycosylase II n=1 Tax=Microlunatus kandeliicorticis TaxID=1759536 RepID=A0A7W3P4V2_9ACTN|nr:DNA-3-methyladenine glycosylase 2 family protein [Microlunatus kandeliicorticis]MBA8793289.1 DNA-3-methyladenine glycosylase II [Microlunatus kandeliicorticis]